MLGKGWLNLITYYLLFLLPALVLALGASRQWFSSEIFVAGLSVYILIYRPLLDGQRLIALGHLAPTERFRLFIPFTISNYYRTLYTAV